MSETIKKNGVKLLIPTFLLAVLAFGATAFNAKSAQEREPVQILLVTKDNAFCLLDRPSQANPTLRLKKGQPVQLTLRNEEPGKILHCFTISEWNVKTHGNLSTGQSQVLAFTPTSRGKFAYACLMHPMMAGTIIVE